MNILALDTTTSACSVALLADEIEVSRSVMMERGHAEALLPMVKDVLNEASWTFADIDTVAVTIGPGAFTGLRIGLAAARGIALAAGIPCVGITSLEAVAEAIGFQERDGRALLVTLDSKRADVFAQVFDAVGQPLGPPVAVSLDGLLDIVPARPLLVAGTAAPTAVDSLAQRGVDAVRASGTGCPHAKDVARVAARLVAAGKKTDQPPSPLYLRPPDTGAPIPAPRPAT
jgi:tRNA threonylcarbamoyladenosine biosynthesis protein TsaB